MSDNTPSNPSDVPPVPPAPYAPPAYGAQPAPAQPAPYGYGQDAAPQQYQQPAPYAQPYPQGAYPYAPATRTNPLAITSLIAAIAAFVVLPFIASIVAVITGHIALKQLRTSGENGRGLALAGTIVGWVGVGLGLIFGVLIVIWIVAVAGAVGYGSYTYS